MSQNSKEWFKQAEYDMGVADWMFAGGKNMYAIFMCHLAIEKGLKGLYARRLAGMPPRVHNLIYLIEKLNLRMPANLYDMVFALNRVSIPTRYPDDLEKLLKSYSRQRTLEMLTQSKEVLTWLKAEFSKPLSS